MRVNLPILTIATAAAAMLFLVGNADARPLKKLTVFQCVDLWHKPIPCPTHSGSSSSNPSLRSYTPPNITYIDAFSTGSNLVWVNQSGRVNIAVVKEVGSFNFADIVQNGMRNLIVVMQSGGVNVANTSQTGRKNKVIIAQEGWVNVAHAHQKGRDNAAWVEQHGKINVADVKQKESGGHGHRHN